MGRIDRELLQMCESVVHHDMSETERYAGGRVHSDREVAKWQFGFCSGDRWVCETDAPSMKERVGSPFDRGESLSMGQRGRSLTVMIIITSLVTERR